MPGLEAAMATGYAKLDYFFSGCVLNIIAELQHKIKN
jgi:hypothetical protein